MTLAEIHGLGLFTTLIVWVFVVWQARENKTKWAAFLLLTMFWGIGNLITWVAFVITLVRTPKVQQ